MVVLGGTGTLWGPMIGGFLYTFLDSRLVDWSANERVQDLPEVLETPLSEPLFVLGVLFILVVYFLPGASPAGGPTAAAGSRCSRRPCSRPRRRRPRMRWRRACDERHAGSAAEVRLAGESLGDGPPALLIQGLGYGRWGWSP